MGADVRQACRGHLDELDADAVRRWGRAAAVALQEHRAEIDGLNVFPVADRDTGSNLALTMAAAAEALDATATATATAAAAAGSAAEALTALARAAVLGARGNSGVIMSQLLRGMASIPIGADGYRAEQVRAGLAAGVEYAYAAVAEPVEGTILTVARAAADAMPSDAIDLLALVRAAAAAAAEALEHTPEQLAPLARAGVVDAGGRGLVLVLDALVRVVAGENAPDVARSTVPEDAPHMRGVRESGSAEFEYEVQYLLDAPPAATSGLRRALLRLGDSVVIAGTGDGTWNVHAHVNDVGAAIEAGVAAGTARQISVVRFDDAAAGATATAVVAVAQGPALRNLFTREAITVVEPAGAALLTAADVLSAIRGSGAAQVVVLPNAAQVAGIAEAAAATARAAGIRVAVVPTRSPVQGLAAVAVHDRLRDFDDDVVAMAEAAAATRFAEIVIATEQSLTSVGICEAGDVLGMIDGEVVEIGRGLVSVAFSLVARLLAVGAEVMTVLVGVDAPTGLGELVAGHVRERAPLTDVTVYLGGASGCPLTIGVE
jgi:DAK2 domain fusion protein YloV